jgi:hypothetical protein
VVGSGSEMVLPLVETRERRSRDRADCRARRPSRRDKEPVLPRVTCGNGGPDTQWGEEDET